MKKLAAVIMIISVLVMSGCSGKDNSINEEIMQSQTNNDNNPFIGDSLTENNSIEIDNNTDDEKFSSFIITIGGQEFNLPESAEEFINKCNSFGGRIITGYKEPDIVEANHADYEPTDFGHVSEEDLFKFGFFNDTEVDKSVLDCYVGSMILTIKYYAGDVARDYLPEVSFPFGISFNSKYDDIITAYGQPKDVLERETRQGQTETILTYNMTDKLIVIFVLDDNGVFEIHMFLTDEYDLEGRKHGRPE